MKYDKGSCGHDAPDMLNALNPGSGRHSAGLDVGTNIAKSIIAEFHSRRRTIRDQE